MRPNLMKLNPWYPGQMGVHGSSSTEGIRLVPQGITLYVDPSHVDASDAHDGVDPNHPLVTITNALSKARDGAGDVIVVMPGSYVENIVVDKNYVTITGPIEGGYGRPDIEGVAGVALTVHAQGFVANHVRLAAANGQVGVVQQGNGYKYEDCVFDGDAETCLSLLPDLDDDSYTASEGAIVGSLFRGGLTGIMFTNPGPGVEGGVSPTDVQVLGNRFYNLTTNAIADTYVGGNNTTFLDSLIAGNYFMDVSAAYVYITLNAGANNTGLISGNYIADDDLIAAQIVVPAGIILAGNIWGAVSAIQQEVIDALVFENLDHLLKVAVADIVDPVDMTAEVVDNSVLTNVLTDDGDTSDYDRRYHSLEALAKILQIEMGYQLKSVAGSAMPIAIWYVDANIAASGDGKTAANAFKTIQEAITACSNTVDDWVLVFDYSGGDAATITIDKQFVHLIGNGMKGMPYPRIMPSVAADGITITDAADRVEIANLVIGAGDQTGAGIAFSGAAGSYGCYIHDCVIGRDATAPALLGISIPGGVDAPYLVIENNIFYGAAGAGIAAAGSAIKVDGNMTYGRIVGNKVLDVGRTATPAIWLSGTVTGPTIQDNHVKTDTDTGTGSAITLSANVSEGWLAGNQASDGKDAPANNPFVDGAATNGWGMNWSGIVAVLPA